MKCKTLLKKVFHNFSKLKGSSTQTVLAVKMISSATGFHVHFMNSCIHGLEFEEFLCQLVPTTDCSASAGKVFFTYKAGHTLPAEEADKQSTHLVNRTVFSRVLEIRGMWPSAHFHVEREKETKSVGSLKFRVFKVSCHAVNSEEKPWEEKT